MRDELHDIVEGVKRISRGLRPPELEEVGLAAAIRAHARRLQESSGVEVSTALADVDQELSLDARLAVYRMVQESLSNVVRHSGAATASVTLALDDGVVTLVVEDQGRVPPGPAGGGAMGLGLIGMQDRIQTLTLRVAHNSGHTHARGSGSLSRERNLLHIPLVTFLRPVRF